MGERKVAIVGAGQVGATFAFGLMISGLATSIVLIDLSPEKEELSVVYDALNSSAMRKGWASC